MARSDTSGRRKCKNVRITPAQKRAGGEGSLSKHWRTYFLQALAATSNVTASAREAGVSPSRAYKARREHAGFAASWRAALNEGYEHLEMEVLACLRGNAPDRKLDVANALRLLAAHRQTVAHIRSAQDEVDEQSVLEAIDDLIDRMRNEAGEVAHIVEEPRLG
ncbi:hypothetical protein J4558_19185 [Leptolyngbya sp. 15MV]|nr:hypothetical protein J4558_19185 [Leptolyngbya sp. 15MV]